MRQHQSPPACPGSSNAAHRINRILAEGDFRVVFPRRPNPVAEEVAKLEAAGFHRAAELVRKENPDRYVKVPAWCKWDPFRIDVYGVPRSIQLLGLGGELAELVERHAADHEIDGNLARSRFSIYEPDRDRPPRYVSDGRSYDANEAAFHRRRAPSDFVEILSCLEDGQPVFTLLVSSLDHGLFQFLSTNQAPAPPLVAPGDRDTYGVV